MACKKHFHIAKVLQATKKRGLAGRVIWGKTPMVTHPITALSKRVLAGIATAKSPVTNITAVAKVVGRGVRECVTPAYDRYLAPMRNDRQAISTEVSCEIAANCCSQAAAAASVIAAIARIVLHSLQTIVPSASLHACCCMRASCGTTCNTYVLLSA